MAAVQRQARGMARRQFWARHLHRWRQSGLSQAEYCRRHQLSAATFAWWKTQSTRVTTGVSPVVSPASPAGKDNGFVEVALPAGSVGVAAGEMVYEIVLSRRRCLRLGCGFELERVRQLLELLEGAC